LFALLDGYFSANIAQNARQYIQYCLCFWPSLAKNYLTDNRKPISSAVTKNFEKYFLQKIF